MIYVFTNKYGIDQNDSSTPGIFEGAPKKGVRLCVTLTNGI